MAGSALRAVVELHQPFGIYDECGHQHDEGEPGVIEVDAVGLTCEEGRIQTVCRGCDTEDGEVDEDTSDGDWPCPTLRVIAERLGVSDAD